MVLQCAQVVHQTLNGWGQERCQKCGQHSQFVLLTTYVQAEKARVHLLLYGYGQNVHLLLNAQDGYVGWLFERLWAPVVQYGPS